MNPLAGRVSVFLTSIFLAAPLLAGTPPWSGKPPLAVPDGTTPLQNAIRNANLQNAQKKRDNLGPGEKKDKCAAALAAGVDADIAKWCDVPKHESKKLGEQTFTHANGKAAGKRTVTRTVLEFDNPNQKSRAGDAAVDRWAYPKVKSFPGGRAYAPGPANGHGGGAFLPSSADNDDHDCVDWVTGQHLRGSQCFDGTKLRATLTPGSAAGTCVHTNGSVFFGDATDNVEDDCWDKNNVLKTTLVELIDEDGPEEIDNDGDGLVNEDPPDGINNDDDCISSTGLIYRGDICRSGRGPHGESYVPLIDEDGPDAIDNDGDGLVNEDAPAAQTEDECQRLYRKAGLEPRAGDKDADGQCDIGRALMKFVNDATLKQSNKKGFKVDAQGLPDSSVTTGVDPGKEDKRRLTLTESFGVKCKAGSTYIDGVCAKDSDIASMGGEAAFHASMSMIGGKKSANGDDPSIPNVAMMGFTFAPPVIEWGYGISEEVCVLGICVEVFSARIGYEFDLALGLRLPVQIDVLDQPESVLAGRDVTLHATVDPLDFRSKDYTDFCNHHGLADGLLISDCQRFGFPDFLDAQFPLISDAKKDGDEFVARYTVFAGVKVTVLGFDLISWGLDSSLDVPAACTMYKLTKLLKEAPKEGTNVDQIKAAINLVTGVADAGTTEDAAIALVDFIKEVAGACGTFTTPFGKEDGVLRAWPFSGSYDVRADCAQALAEGEVVTIKGQKRPICTNMILGISGASLGIGLGVEATVGSRLIDGSFTTSEDATRTGGVQWTQSANEGSGAAQAITVHPDNYDARDFHDTARVKLDDFTYYLDALQLSLKANLQFGGILDPIPDIGGFTIYNFVVDFGRYGLPIPQHPGTEGIAIDIPVENYGLKLDVKPASSAPNVDTLLIEPGKLGAYDVSVRNLGSRTGTFDNFRVALSNRPSQTPPYRFGIDRNTDHDCVRVGNGCGKGFQHFRGDPYDGVADACYDANGVVLATMVECIDEDGPSNVEGLSAADRDDDGDGIPDDDPPEQWITTPDSAAFGLLQIASIQPYTWSTAAQSLKISVSPFRHPYTKPGIYPILVQADSKEAKANSMAATDPSGHARKDAQDVSFVEVKAFFEPQVVVLPNADGGKPSITRKYTIEGTNGANVDDSMSVRVDFLDSNLAGCTLTTLGRLAAGTTPGCPYRSVPTAVPVAWTTAPALSPLLPRSGLLQPLTSASDAFTLAVPRDWAGMVDTTYRFKVTAVSQKDPDAPPATKSFIAQHKVTATKESMTRYIGLEIADLIATLTAADNAGVKLGGAKPIAVHPIQQTNDSALEAILAGNFSKASTNHATNIQLVQAFVKTVDSGEKTLPPALFTDLKNRAAAMLADLAAAQASNVPSEP